MSYKCKSFHVQAFKLFNLMLHNVVCSCKELSCVIKLLIYQGAVHKLELLKPGKQMTRLLVRLSSVVLPSHGYSD